MLEKSPACFAKRLAIKHHDSISWLIPDRYFVFSAPGGKIHLNIKESSMCWHGLWDDTSRKKLGPYRRY